MRNVKSCLCDNTDVFIFQIRKFNCKFFNHRRAVERKVAALAMPFYALYLRMVFVADNKNGFSCPGFPRDRPVYFGDEWAGRVRAVEPEFRNLAINALRNAMGTNHDRAAFLHIPWFVHRSDTAAFKLLDHFFVVDNRPERTDLFIFIQQAVYHIDRPVYSKAEAGGFCQSNFLRQRLRHNSKSFLKNGRNGCNVTSRFPKFKIR